jgi:FtsZ-interacting cell division protein YlmF
MGTFPFGWVRGIEKDNWQILWDSQTKSIYAKGAISKKLVDIGQPSSWEEAKTLADMVQNEPEVYLNFSQLDNS